MLTPAPNNNKLTPAVSAESERVTRTELARYAERQELSCARIFSFPTERIGRQAALQLIDEARSQKEKAGETLVKAADCLSNLARLQIAAILDLHLPITFGHVLTNGASLLSTVGSAKGAVKSTNPMGSVMHMLGSVLDGVRSAFLNPYSLAITLHQVGAALLSKKRKSRLVSEMARPLTEFAATLRKIPTLALPSEKQLRRQLRQVSPENAELAAAHLQQARDAQSLVNRLLAQTTKLEGDIKAYLLDGGLGRGYWRLIGMSPVGTQNGKIREQLVAFLKSLLQIDSYREALEVKRPLGILAIRSWLAGQGITSQQVVPANSASSGPTSQGEGASSNPATTQTNLAHSEDFLNWWKKTAKTTLETQRVIMILQASGMIANDLSDPASRATLDRIQTQLKEISIEEKHSILDQLVMDGILSSEQRRKSESWILGLEIVRQELLQSARDAFRPFVQNKRQREILIQATGESDGIEVLQKRVAGLVECAELMLETTSLSNKEIGDFLLQNPRIFEGVLSTIQTVCLTLCAIDAKLGSAEKEHANAIRSKLLELKGCSHSDTSSFLSNLLVDISLPEPKELHEKSEAAVVAAPQSQEARERSQTVVSRPALKTQLRREYEEIIDELEQDPICARWDSRELMAVIAGFSKKSQIWMGESYFRTEYLRRNVNTLLGYQITELMGTVRFLSREGVVGHLGYKGGVTVASLNPNIDAISNKALRRAATYLRMMVDPQKKGEIVALIKESD